MSNDSSTAETVLADRLDAITATLVARSLEYMPHDEFWERRYAARGTRFAREDGAFHVRYLVDALRAESPTVMTEYARWLRDLLVPRGMCTLHVAEHFENLALAVEPEPDSAAAVRYIGAAIAALEYADGSPAAAIQRAADRVERQVASLPPASGALRNSAWETRYLCHYAADAIARADAGLLSRHLGWAKEIYRNDHGNTDRFDAWVGSVSTSLSGANLPPGFLPSPGEPG